MFITLLFGCLSESKQMDFIDKDVSCKSEKTTDDFKTFPDKNPDSVSMLLQRKFNNIDNHTITSDEAQKILLFSEWSFKNHREIKDASSIQKTVFFFDSIFYADSVGKNDAAVFLQNQWLRARSYYVLGKMKHVGYEYLDAMKNHLTSLRILEEWFSDVEKPSINLLKGNIQTSMGDAFYNTEYFDLSKKSYLSGFDYFMKTGDSAAIAYSCGKLGDFIVFIESGDSSMNTAYHFSNQGLQYAKPCENPYESAILYSIIGHYHRHYDQFDSAICYFKKAIDLMPKENDMIHTLYASLSVAYYFQQNYDSALLYILKGCESNHLYRKCLTARGASDIFRKMGNNAQASEYSEQYEEFQRQIEKIKSNNYGIQTLYDDYQKHKIIKQAVDPQSNMIYCLIFTGFVILIIGIYLARKSILKHTEKAVALLQQYEEKVFQEKWNSFIKTEIYQHIHQLCAQKLPVKNVEDANIALSKAQWAELQNAIDFNFDQFTQRLKQAFPKLEKVDLEYSYLSILNLDEAHKAALCGILYQGSKNRRTKLCEKFNTDDLNSILFFYLKNEQKTPKNSFTLFLHLFIKNNSLFKK